MSERRKKNMISKIHRVLGPLDVGPLGQAFEKAGECETSMEAACDQALEDELHRELIEIAKLYGVTE